jgi:hypothetical protein
VQRGHLVQGPANGNSTSTVLRSLS